MLLFGVLPALRAGRVDVQSVLQHAGRPGMSAAYRGARRALVAGEVALSVVLLWGAVLLLETLWRMQHDHLGFAPEHVVNISIPLPGPVRGRNLDPALARRGRRKYSKQIRRGAGDDGRVVGRVHAADGRVHGYRFHAQRPTSAEAVGPRRDSVGVRGGP